MLYNKKSTERKKYQRHDWTMHIKKWQESGLSQSEYCRQNGLNDRAFSYNYNKMKIIDSPSTNRR